MEKRNIIHWFSDQVNNLLDSMNLKDEGWSFRKIAALHGIWVAIIATLKYSSETNFIEVLSIWLCFVLICMALIKPESFLNLGKRNPQNNDTPSV